MIMMMMMATIDEKSNTSESQQLQVLLCIDMYIIYFDLFSSLVVHWLVIF